MQEFVADLSVDLLHFRVPEPAKQIDYVHSVIKHCTAPCQFVINKPAARHRAVIGGLDAVDFTQYAHVELLLQLDHRRGEAHRKGNLQFRASLLTAVNHRLAVFKRRGNGLLAKDALNATGRLQNQRRVQRIF